MYKTTPIHHWDLYAETSVGTLLSCIIFIRFQFGKPIPDIFQSPFKVHCLVFQFVKFIFLRKACWVRGIGRYSMRICKKRESPVTSATSLDVSCTEKPVSAIPGASTASTPAETWCLHYVYMSGCRISCAKTGCSSYHWSQAMRTCSISPRHFQYLCINVFVSVGLLIK